MSNRHTQTAPSSTDGLLHGRTPHQCTVCIQCSVITTTATMTNSSWPRVFVVQVRDCGSREPQRVQLCVVPAATPPDHSHKLQSEDHQARYELLLLLLLLLLHPFNDPFFSTTWVSKCHNQSGFKWSKRFGDVAASAGPYANNLHLAPSRQPHQQTTTPRPHHSICTGQMLFLTPNQQRQSTEGTSHWTEQNSHV